MCESIFMLSCLLIIYTYSIKNLRFRCLKNPFLWKVFVSFFLISLILVHIGKTGEREGGYFIGNVVSVMNLTQNFHPH